MINIYYTSPADLRTILKDTDPIDCVYTFIIVAEEVYHTVWLYTKWHDDGTASYEHIYLRPDGYTIEANWIE